MPSAASVKSRRVRAERRRKQEDDAVALESRADFRFVNLSPAARETIEIVVMRGRAFVRAAFVSDQRHPIPGSTLRTEGDVTPSWMKNGPNFDAGCRLRMSFARTTRFVRENRCPPPRSIEGVHFRDT